MTVCLASCQRSKGQKWTMVRITRAKTRQNANIDRRMMRTIKNPTRESNQIKSNSSNKEDKEESNAEAEEENGSGSEKSDGSSDSDNSVDDMEREED
jgi:hypothetical protein